MQSGSALGGSIRQKALGQLAPRIGRSGRASPQLSPIDLRSCAISAGTLGLVEASIGALDHRSGTLAPLMRGNADRYGDCTERLPVGTSLQLPPGDLAANLLGDHDGT